MKSTLAQLQNLSLIGSSSLQTKSGTLGKMRVQRTMICWKWCADTRMDTHLFFYHIIYVISLVTLHFNVVF